MAVARKCAFMSLGGAYANVFFNSYNGNFCGAPTPAGMGVANLLTEEPTERCRITTLDPVQTFYATSTAATGISVAFDGFALIGVNMSPWGLFRATNPGGTFMQSSAPTALIAPTNIVNSLADVDELITDSGGASGSDGVYIMASTVANQWSARFGFSPSGAFASEPKGFIVLRVGLFGSPIDHYPTIGVELWDNGSLRAYLGKRAVTKTDQILIFPFDRSQLSNLTGATLQARVIGDPVAGGVADARLDTIRLDYPASGVTTMDSGWQSSPLSTVDGTIRPNNNLVYFFPAPVSANVLAVFIADDQTTHFTDAMNGAGVLKGLVTKLPDGYSQVGVAVAGPALFMSKGWTAQGPSPKPIIEQRGGVTMGGQTYGADAWRRRALSGTLYETGLESNLINEYLAWNKGKSGAFLMASEPDLLPSDQRFRSFWATLVDIGEVQEVPTSRQTADFDTVGLFQQTVSFEEKL